MTRGRHVERNPAVRFRIRIRSQTRPRNAKGPNQPAPAKLTNCHRTIKGSQDGGGALQRQGEVSWVAARGQMSARLAGESASFYRRYVTNDRTRGSRFANRVDQIHGPGTPSRPIAGAPTVIVRFSSPWRFCSPAGPRRDTEDGQGTPCPWQWTDFRQGRSPSSTGQWTMTKNTPTLGHPKNIGLVVGAMFVFAAHLSNITHNSSNPSMHATLEICKRTKKASYTETTRPGRGAPTRGAPLAHWHPPSRLEWSPD